MSALLVGNDATADDVDDRDGLLLALVRADDVDEVIARFQSTRIAQHVGASAAAASPSPQRHARLGGGEEIVSRRWRGGDAARGAPTPEPASLSSAPEPRRPASEAAPLLRAASSVCVSEVDGEVNADAPSSDGGATPDFFDGDVPPPLWRRDPTLRLSRGLLSAPLRSPTPPTPTERGVEPRVEPRRRVTIRPPTPPDAAAPQRRAEDERSQSDSDSRASASYSSYSSYSSSYSTSPASSDGGGAQRGVAVRSRPMAKRAPGTVVAVTVPPPRQLAAKAAPPPLRQGQRQPLRVLAPAVTKKPNTAVTSRRQMQAPPPTKRIAPQPTQQRIPIPQRHAPAPIAVPPRRRSLPPAVADAPVPAASSTPTTEEQPPAKAEQNAAAPSTPAAGEQSRPPPPPQQEQEQEQQEQQELPRPVTPAPMPDEESDANTPPLPPPPPKTGGRCFC